jgi:hypothetical protein
MAKAKTLAALAGLAGLAYAMRNKGKYNEDAGDQKTSSYTKDTKKVEAKDEPRRQITDYIKKAPEAEDANYGNEGRRTSMGVAPTLKTITKAAPTAKTPSTSDARNLESGMSRGTRPSVAKNPDYSNEGRISAAPTAKNPDYSNEGRNSVTPTSTPVKTSTGFSRVPTSEQASANRQAAMDKVKSVGSDVADYVRNFETPAERRSREAKEASGMKRGGMVSKVSSASSRADGIATKGKTRGKIC